MRASPTLLLKFDSGNWWQIGCPSVSILSKNRHGSPVAGLNPGLTVIQIMYWPGGTDGSPSPPSRPKYCPPRKKRYVSHHPCLTPSLPGSPTAPHGPH